MNENKLNSSMIVFLPMISIAAIALSVVVALSIGSSYKLLFSNVSSIDSVDIEANCKSNAGKLMLSAQSQNNGELLRIVVDQGKDLSPQQSFSNISTLLLSCDGYVMDYFCAGAGCPNGDKITADFKVAVAD